MSLIVRAPAKVNLDLRVLGRRSDGYHELRTILQSIALHDTVRLTVRAGPLRVRSRSHDVPANRDNIVWLAVQALWSEMGEAGSAHGIVVDITKRIPVGGGLGGGSSNAASALRGLCAIWGYEPGRECLHRLAASLGADVPYFLRGGLALGTGRGDALRQLRDLHQRWVVVAVPRFAVSSRAAYRWFRASRRRSSPTLSRSWRMNMSRLTNDLAGPVMDRHPSLSVMVERLRQLGAVHTAMTGSGSSVFALFATRRRAVDARRSVRSQGWRTILTHTLSREAFADLIEIER